MRIARGEIDVLALDKKSASLVLIEVRGAGRRTLPPSKTLPFSKQKRLERMANVLIQKYRRPLRMEFLEIRGDFSFPWWADAFLPLVLGLWPERFGVQLRAYDFGPCFTAPK